jgi:hypothetical protein
MEQTTYLCKFDTDGKRTETLLTCEFTEEEKAEKIADGYIEISEEDWNYYVGNKGQGKNGTGYIRGKDGKPVDAPAHVPTTEEKKQAIIAQYESDKAGLQEQLIDAILHDDTELQSEIKAEMTAVDEAFDEAIRELEG